MPPIRVWAPKASGVDVVIDDVRHPMTNQPGGWWAAAPPGLVAGVDYWYALDGGDPLPDPRSAWQPDGVHGPSRLVDHAAFGWSDDGWRGVPLEGSVIYELHVGTFTPDATFDAAIERLEHLVELGVDLVELLPVNAFPGSRGWGYDGVGWFAVHDPYGGPAGLKRFVDACHARGLGVVMDVVYNHLGPDGNYLGEFGPYFTDKYRTPWGPAVNFDDAGSDEVRRYVVDNALMWLRDYHCDGLRLDAVHAIVDSSATHILEEIATAVHALGAQLGRSLFVIAESDLNDPRLVRNQQAGGYGLDAQWSDDFHHALHAVLTGEQDGYYVDFGAIDDIAAAWTQGYVYIGQHSRYRGRRHGRRPSGVPGYRFLGYVQTHDQVGNRAQGERISALVSPGLAKVAAALVLTSPFTPMLFMGEEWGASTPWQYFTDHQDAALADAVRKGRREEFAAFGWEPADVPDPQDIATYERSRLDWSELRSAPHSELFDWYRSLLSLRRAHPDLGAGVLDDVEAAYDEDARWLVMVRGNTAVVGNFLPDRQGVPLPRPAVEVLLASSEGAVLSDVDVQLDGESVVIVSLQPLAD